MVVSPSEFYLSFQIEIFLFRYCVKVCHFLAVGHLRALAGEGGSFGDFADHSKLNFFSFRYCLKVGPFFR